MNENDFLRLLEKIIKNEGLNVLLFNASKEKPTEHLVVYLGVDTHDRPIILHIETQKQMINPKKDSRIFRVAFNVKLPFKINPLSFADSSHFIAFLNRFLDLPGFELNELDDEIFYRYIWLTKVSGVDREMLLGLVGAIKFIIDMHLNSIESVTSGRLSYNEILEQALKTS